MREQVAQLLPKLHHAMRSILTPALQNGYGDDVVQEAWIKCWHSLDKGYSLSWRLIRLHVRRSIRDVFGDTRRQWRPPWNKHVFELPASGAVIQRESMALCMRRLQEVWPTLTGQQQAGLVAMLDGRGAAAEYATQAGVSLASLSRSRRQALARIDNPSAFSRAAQSQVPHSGSPVCP